MMYLVYLIAGIVIGVIIEIFQWSFYMHSITYGTLKEAQEDGEEPYLFLDLDMRPDDIMKRKYVVFKVDPNKITPHD